MFLSALLLFMPLLSAQGAMIGNHRIIAQTPSDLSRQELQQLLDQDKARQQLRALGVSPVWAQARVESLSNQELVRINQGIGNLDTGESSVLGYHAIDVSPGQLVDAVYLPARHGSLPAEMAATARRYGMLAYPLDSSLGDLLSEVAHGHPVLIFQNLGTSWFPQRHFAVVIGYDLNRSEVILRSGRTVRWRTSLATLERTWSRSDYWALVILPPGEVPATADPQPYLQAVLDLETSGHIRAATAAYRAANRRCPKHPLPWIALGNSRYTAGDYAGARAAFRRVTRLQPASAHGWNNLAYALLQTGCPHQAVQAAVCATDLAPDDPDVQDTRNELGIVTQGGNRLHCLPILCPTDNAQ